MVSMLRAAQVALLQARGTMDIELAAVVQRVQILVVEQRGRQTLEAAAVEQKNVSRATTAALE